MDKEIKKKIDYINNKIVQESLLIVSEKLFQEGLIDYKKYIYIKNKMG